MMFRYVCPPIDWFWGCMTLGEFFSQMIKEWPGESSSSAKEIAEITRTLMEEAKKIDQWEGDIRGNEFYVFGLPDSTVNSEMDYGFIWKQENNGTTFIISLKELPWLSKYNA